MAGQPSSPEPDRPVEVPCVVCGSSRAEPFLQGFDRLFDRERRFRIVRCADCALLHLSPRSEEAEGEEDYPDDYFLYHMPLSKPTDKAATGGLKGLKWRLDAHNLRRMGYARDDLPEAGAVERALAPLRRGKYRHEVLPPRGGCRMLEVGCGTGLFLYRHRSLGWETLGVEMSEKAASIARKAGLNVVSERIEQSDMPEGHFDVIVLMHVLEHLEDPVGILTRLRPLLAPNGRVMIEVPNASALGMRIFGSYWFALDLPRHLHHFKLADIERLSDQAGFRVTRHLFRNVGDWYSRSVDYWLRDRDWLPGFLRRGEPCRRLKLERRLRLLLAPFRRGHAGDALRLWLEPV